MIDNRWGIRGGMIHGIARRSDLENKDKYITTNK